MHKTKNNGYASEDSAASVISIRVQKNLHNTEPAGRRVALGRVEWAGDAAHSASELDLHHKGEETCLSAVELNLPSQL